MPVLKRYNSTTQEWEVIGGGSGGGGGASTLSDLTDTNISTPTDGQVLTYDNNISKWVNSNNFDISGKADKVSGATNGDLAGLDSNGNLTDSGIAGTDVSTVITNSHTHSNKTYLDKIPQSTGSNGQVLTSNGSAWSWSNVPTELPSQTGQSGKFLTTNGSSVSWATVSSGSSTLSGLTDTTITTPTDRQVLTYDNNTSKWVNANVPTELPSITGNASKILSVNSGATGVEWITNSGGGGGLTNYDFTHVANTTVSSPFTFTCAANQRNSQKITTGANLTLNITCNNGSDNYLWIVNSSSANDIDVVLGTVTYNGTTLTNSSITVPPDGITVPKSGFCEMGIIMNADGCIITSRNDLVPSV